MRNSRPIRTAGNIAAGIWIFGGALFFFCRFTMAFYEANRTAILGLLDRLAQVVG